MVVVAKRHAGRFHLLANGIELVGHVTPVIQIQLALVRRIAMHSAQEQMMYSSPSACPYSIN